MTSSYTKKKLNEMASSALKQYRKVHKDRVRRYVFADVPWHITVGDSGVQLNVQIKDSDSGWTENYSYAL